MEGVDAVVASTQDGLQEGVLAGKIELPFQVKQGKGVVRHGAVVFAERAERLVDFSLGDWDHVVLLSTNSIISPFKGKTRGFRVKSREKVLIEGRRGKRSGKNFSPAGQSAGFLYSISPNRAVRFNRLLFSKRMCISLSDFNSFKAASRSPGPCRRSSAWNR